MKEQVPNNARLGIEISLDLPEHLPEQELTPSSVAPNENDDNFLGLFYRVDVKSLKDWTSVTQFMRGSIGYVVKESDVTEYSKQLVFIVYGSNWDKRVLVYQTMIIEHLNAFITDYAEMTSRMKWAWLNQLDSWTISHLRAQLKSLAESRGFLENE